jgi:hypothetical protein
MKRCLQSVLILSLLALVSAPAFAVGPCWQVCTCSSSCSQRCVDPDGRGTTCFNGWDCIGSCLGAQPADPVQEQRADKNLLFRVGGAEPLQDTFTFETCSAR